MNKRKMIMILVSVCVCFILLFGIVLRDTDFAVKSYPAPVTKPFKDTTEANMKKYFFKKAALTILDWILENTKLILRHPATNNLVNYNTKKIVGEKVWNEPAHLYCFGEEKKNKKEQLVYDQEVSCSVTAGENMNYMYWWMMEHYDKCEPEFIQCYRTQWEQAEKWVTSFGRSASRPFKSTEGNHSIGRSVDIHNRCRDGRYPLGKLTNGKIVWWTKKGPHKGKIPGDSATKPDVLEWIEKVRFTKRFEEIKKEAKEKSAKSAKWTFSFNREKCLEHSYKKLRSLIQMRLEGVTAVIYTPAKERGMTGCGCTKARALDAVHFDIIYVDVSPNKSEKTREYEAKYAQCSLYSDMWEDYVERSYTKNRGKNPKEERLDVIPFSACTNKVKK